MPAVPQPRAAPSAERSNPLRHLERIWHIRGAIPIPAGQTPDEAIERLDPLFHTTGTTHHRRGDGIEFSKTDPGAQDKMSIFDSGTLRIEGGAGGAMLRYHLVSRALLYCFLAPLLFLAVAQGISLLVKAQAASPAAASKAAKTAEAKKKLAATVAAVPQNPIDTFLGAPAPAKPKKGEGGGRGDRKPSPTPAYVFAGLFAALYVIGRILEDRLARRLFARKLAGE